MRVLVAIEDDYGAYRSVIAEGLRILRPCVEVATSNLGALEDELSRLEPHVVICTLSPATAGSGDRLAWVELSLVPTRPTTIRLGDRQWRSTNLMLAELLGVIDEVESLLWERMACDSE
jgi:hypothetical protein